jgi:hypothetical protein
MTNHANVETVDRMTGAIFAQDHDTLAAIFTDDFVFHHRSPLHLAGDYTGVGGLLETLGYFFEATGGDKCVRQVTRVPVELLRAATYPMARAGGQFASRR